MMKSYKGLYLGTSFTIFLPKTNCWVIERVTFVCLEVTQRQTVMLLIELAPLVRRVDVLHSHIKDS